VVDVATADNDAEAALILREERRNYHDLRLIPVRVSRRACMGEAV